MASVHGFNEALAEVRGVPFATIEAYSRALRREGVLPQTKRGGGGPFTSVMAGYLLAGVLRGSPTAAADNAREVGNLIVHSDGGALLEPVLQAQLKMFGWADDMSFACMVGWLIDRHLDGTIDKFIDTSKGYRIEVDRYWTTARLYCHPAPPLIAQYVDARREAFKDVEPPPLPEQALNGALARPMEIGFHTPLLHEMKINYDVNQARASKATRKFFELRKCAGKFDLWGSESVTQRTLIAIAEVFK
jgi:hypothetical protein